MSASNDANYSIELMACVLYNQLAEVFMDTKKKALFVLAISALCVICAVVILIQFTKDSAGGRSYSITEPYDYDSITGTPEWRGIQLRSDRGARLAIPEDVYLNMTTEALLKSVVSYPFLIDMSAFDSYRVGFLTLYQERKELYPEINEMVNRTDFSSVLIKEYVDMPIVHPVWEYNIYLEHMEILIAQPEVTGGLSDEDTRTLAEIAKQKHDEKTAANHIYSDPKTFYRAVNENHGTALHSSVSNTFR